jgi:hypothetical protein
MCWPSRLKENESAISASGWLTRSMSPRPGTDPDRAEFSPRYKLQLETL